MVDPSKASPVSKKKSSIQIKAAKKASHDPIELGELLRKAIYPIYNHERFSSTLKQYPDILEDKLGPIQETLLHR